MNQEETRKILSVYRPEDRSDPALAQAAEEAARDPALSAWFGKEQEFDRRFSQALQSAAIPPGLKPRVLAGKEAAARQRLRRSRAMAWTVATVAVLFAFFSLWHGPFTPAPSLADFRGEMISFIKLAPPLELESSRVQQIQLWLETAGAPSSVSIPPGLEALEPIGCRVLFFRGHKVTLICFRRGGPQLVHLIVVDHATLSGLPADAKVTFAEEAGWMTAAWRESDRTYLLAASGDRQLLKHYLHPKAFGATLSFTGIRIACETRSPEYFIGNSPYIDRVQGGLHSQ